MKSFEIQARNALAEAGMNPDLYRPLAEWAVANAGNGTVRKGVLIDVTGVILVETTRNPRHNGLREGVFVTGAPATMAPEIIGLKDMALGDAMVHLRRILGRPVVYISYARLCEKPMH